MSGLCFVQSLAVVYLSSVPVHSARSRRDIPNLMLPTVPLRLQWRQNGMGRHMKSRMLSKLSILWMSM